MGPICKLARFVFSLSSTKYALYGGLGFELQFGFAGRIGFRGIPGDSVPVLFLGIRFDIHAPAEERVMSNKFHESSPFSSAAGAAQPTQRH